MRQKALVVHPVLPAEENGRDPLAKLDEAVGLAAAIDLDVTSALLVRVNEPKPGTLLGSGKVNEIGRVVAETSAGLVVIDHALSPVQQRNLERAWKAKVIDRTGLILEIFGERAHTREGSLQVELAALSYQRSRLVRSWTHLERQRGGFGFLGGPGESQIEMDRRLIGERIVKLKRELEQVRRTRGLHRSARKKVPNPVLALVGYTNAGKSTLFNRLSGADVRAEDLLFATLDPTMRGITLPSGRRIILSDTVGFISDLPTHLVAAFRATLEEVEQADLILHVRDIAHPDSEAQKADVLEVLSGMGIEAESDGRVIQVLNKIDKLPPEEHDRLISRTHRPEILPVSALTGEGIRRLLELVDRRLMNSREIVDLRVDLSDGSALAWLYRMGEVIDRQDEDGVAVMRVGMDSGTRARFETAYPYRPN
ncbi:MAG TPA: GTPase HflX [Alphaproteobacteria bacterium]|nr:GTPase HflX [Alphaproteobacteria bacterium]